MVKFNKAMKGGLYMQAAGAIILFFGIVFALQGIRQRVAVGSIHGAAGPVMIIVGAIMLFYGS